MNRPSEGFFIGAEGTYPDLVAIEREARRLRAEHLAVLLRRAVSCVRRGPSTRPMAELPGGARPSLG